MEVLPAIDLLRVFELPSRDDVIYFDFARFQWRSSADALWALDGAHRSFGADHLFPDVVPCPIVAVSSVPEALIREWSFSFDGLCAGIGIVLGFDQTFLGLVQVWLDQLDCPCVITEVLPFLKATQDGWGTQLILFA